MESDVATDYLPIEKLLNSLDTQHSAFKHSITKDIQDILPKIRAGGAAEKQLTDLLAKYDQSPFSKKKYSAILKTRNREVEVIQSILKVAKELKNVKVDVDDSGESFSCGLEHQGCNSIHLKMTRKLSRKSSQQKSNLKRRYVSTTDFMIFLV